MQTHLDPTIINVNNSPSPLQEELKLLINAIFSMVNEYQTADEEFRTLLYVNPLYAIQKSLTNQELLSLNTPQDVLSYLTELVRVRRSIKQYLTEIHAPLIKKLIKGEFELLQYIILKLETQEQSLSKSWEAFHAANGLLNDLMDEHQTESAPEIKESLDRLEDVLEKRTLQQEINEEIIQFKNFNPDASADYDEFITTIAPIKQKFINLKQKALAANLNDSVDMLATVISQINIMSAHYTKKRLDSHIEHTQKSLWSTVDVKKHLYIDLLDRVDALLQVAPLLELSEIDKETYINQLRLGFELCLDARFLDVLNQCATIFYNEDQEKLQQINNYVEHSRTNLPLSQASFRKKRVRIGETTNIQSKGNESNENTPDPDMHRSKRSKKDEIDTTEQSNSPLLEAVINIIDPVCKPDEILSRRFAAAMLKSLSKSIWSINELDRGIKVQMIYDMLHHALNLCPTEAAPLWENLNSLLADLTERNKRQIADYKKFSQTQSNHITPVPLSHEAFKKILTEFTDELTVSIPPESLNGVLQRFLNAWITNLKEDKLINGPFLDQITGQIQKSIPPQETTSPSTDHSESPKRVFKTLKEALSSAGPSEFTSYLENLRTRMDVPGHYLNYLVNKDRAGYTPLHHLLKTGRFHNVEAYINEVKKMFGEQTESFHSFLISQTSFGSTFLHQIAASGDKVVLGHFTQLLKVELGNEGYAKALRITNKGNSRPCGNPAVPNYIEINDILERERRKFPLKEQDPIARGRLFTPPSQVFRKAADAVISQNNVLK